MSKVGAHIRRQVAGAEKRADGRLDLRVIERAVVLGIDADVGLSGGSDSQSIHVPKRGRKCAATAADRRPARGGGQRQICSCVSCAKKKSDKSEVQNASLQEQKTTP